MIIPKLNGTLGFYKIEQRMIFFLSFSNCSLPCNAFFDVCIYHTLSIWLITQFTQCVSVSVVELAGGGSATKGATASSL